MHEAVLDEFEQLHHLGLGLVTGGSELGEPVSIRVLSVQ
jgi:hypothetical protein